MTFIATDHKRVFLYRSGKCTSTGMQIFYTVCAKVGPSSLIQTRLGQPLNKRMGDTCCYLNLLDHPAHILGNVAGSKMIQVDSPP